MNSQLSTITSQYFDPWLFFKATVIFLIGPIDLQIFYLLVAVGIDLCFGINTAIKLHSFSWTILYQKMGHKIAVYGLWVAMFHAFDMICNWSNEARWGVIVALFCLEVSSAIKNTAKSGDNRLAKIIMLAYLSLLKIPGEQKEIIKETSEEIKEDGNDHETK